MSDRSVLRRVRRKVRRVAGLGTRVARKGLGRARRLAELGASSVTMRDLPPRPQGWNAVLHTVRWLDDGRLELTGWAHDWQTNYSGHPVATTVVLVSLFTNQRVYAQVNMTPSQEPNLPRRETPDEYDYAPTQFMAVLDVRQLAVTASGAWVVRLIVEDGPVLWSGPFTRAVATGSAGFLVPKAFGDRRARPGWSADEGLRVTVERSVPSVRSCEVRGRQVTLGLTTGGERIREAALVGPQGTVRLTLAKRGTVASGSVPNLDPDQPWRAEAMQRWLDTADLAQSGGVPIVRRRLVLQTDRGSVVAPSDVELAASDPHASLVPEIGQDGEFWLADSPVQLIVDDVLLARQGAPHLRVWGRVFGDPGKVTLTLVGAAEQISAPLRVGPDGTAFAEFPLLVSRWGQPLAAPASGQYVLEAEAEGQGHFAAYCGRAVIDRSRENLLDDWFRLRLEVLPGRRLGVRLSRPLTDDEIGPVNQSRLKEFYDRGGHAPRDAVFLECFRGRQVGCNPLALDEVLRLQRPELPRLWSVVDRSLLVPDGAEGVVEGSRAWWAARGGCRWVITNDWLRARFRHQPHQTVLQTWHGTMYKRIGLDLPTMTPEKAPDYVAERGKWDLLLSQNPHSSEVFRSAYEWDRELIEDGYPRNDVLFSGSPDRCRQALQIKDGVKVIMYAPTWRDDRTDVVTHLDVSELARQLGDDYVVLMRGHWRPMRFGSGPALSGRAIDVSTYPSIAELFLVADAVITDYSSLMFDYSITGRPMIFYVPDLADYRDVVRGVYFDLAESAPGPVVETFEDVVAAVRSMEVDKQRYAAKYAAWRERFNPWDDGHCSERVLARLFAESPAVP